MHAIRSSFIMCLGLFLSTVVLFTGCGRPQKPGNVQITDITDNSFIVHWVDSSANEEGFIIEIDKGDGSATRLDTAGSGQQRTVVTNLEGGRLYGVSVVAYNSHGRSDIAGPAICTTSVSGHIVLHDTITASCGNGGQITPAGSISVNHGSTQTFTVKANAGFHVADLVVDGVSEGAQTSWLFTNVTADHTIRATFAADVHTVTASCGNGGWITPTGSVSVNHGSNQTFTFGANVGYHVADLVVDGVSEGARTSWPFTNVTANHTIRATFAVDSIDTIIPPSNPVAVNAVPCRLTLQWQNAQQGNVSFSVYRSDTNGQMRRVAVSILNTQWVDTAVSPGSNYTYGVTTCVGQRESQMTTTFVQVPGDAVGPQLSRNWQISIRNGTWRATLEIAGGSICNLRQRLTKWSDASQDNVFSKFTVTGDAVSFYRSNPGQQYTGWLEWDSTHTVITQMSGLLDNVQPWVAF